MGKQAKEEEEEEEEKNKNKINMETRESRVSKSKKVMISVYVESPALPPPIQPHHKKLSHHNVPIKKAITNTTTTKSKPIIHKNSQIAETRSYDRRAQLLAYAQQLRNTHHSKHPQWPKNINGSRLNHNMMSSKKSTPARFERTRSRKRYHRLVPEVVDISCRPKSIIGTKLKKKKKASKHTDSHFVGKLRGILRGFCRD